MDKVSKEKRSEIMSHVRSEETSIEKDFGKSLWAQGIRYRKNNPKYFGKPDLTIASKQIAIFIDSCFWHGCKQYLRLPASNVKYWTEKISRNILRDNTVNKYYKEKGWIVFRIWEHELRKKNKEAILEEVKRLALE